LVRDINQTWRNIGATNRKLKKDLQRRFRAAMQVLKSHLDEERQRNCHYRLLLIGQVDEVAHNLKEGIGKNTETLENRKFIDTKTNEAIPQVQALEIEQNWYLSSAVFPEQTQRLEQRFSKACEAFYSRQQ
jgi:exonuclease SbcC